jgi:hypothetical protein
MTVQACCADGANTSMVHTHMHSSAPISAAAEHATCLTASAAATLMPRSMTSAPHHSTANEQAHRITTKSRLGAEHRAWLQGHLGSLKKEQASCAAPLARLVPNLSVHVSGTVDWQYLVAAQCVLLECRRVLSNAYVFSFFMFDAANFEQARALHCVAAGLHTLQAAVYAA